MKDLEIRKKKCSKCKVEMPISGFNKHCRQKDGYDCQCRLCHRKVKKAFEKTRAYKDNRNTRTRRRRKELPAVAILETLRGRLSGALNGKRKVTSSRNIMQISIEGLCQHLENQFQPGMSWENRGKPEDGSEGWDVDHRIPCAAFDFNDPNQQYICFWFQNLQPLWHTENMEKSDKYNQEDKDKLIEDWHHWCVNHSTGAT